MIIQITCSKCGFVFTAKSEFSVEDAKQEFRTWGGFYRDAFESHIEFIPAKALCVFCAKPKKISAYTPTPKELDVLIYTLKRCQLAHALRGIRTKNNPDKAQYHAVMVEDCRAKIEYIRGIRS